MIGKQKWRVLKEIFLSCLHKQEVKSENAQTQQQIILMFSFCAQQKKREAKADKETKRPRG